MGDEVVTSRAVVRTRWKYGRFASLVLVVPLLYFIPDIVQHGIFGVLGVFAVYLPALIGLIVLEHRTWRTATRRVTANATGLSLDSVLAAPKSKISGARVSRRGESVVLRINQHLQPIEVEVASEAEGRAMVAALCLDEKQSIASFWFHAGSRIRGRVRLVAQLATFVCQFAVLFKAPELLGVAIGLPIALLLPLALLVIGYLALGPLFARVVVGADGLRIRNDFRREQFVPYAALAAVDAVEGEVTLRFHDQEPITFNLGTRGVGRYLESLGSNSWGEGEEIVQAFIARVRESAALHQAGSGDASSIARAGRATREWLSDLHGLSERGAAYRVAVPTADALWRIVEDRTRPAGDRVPAAIALRASLDDAGRARIHASAESSADPTVRAALYAAAGANDEKLLATLDEIDDGEDVERAKQARR